MLWIIVSLVLGFAAAAVGGYVCRLNDKAVKILAVAALVRGLLMAFSEASKDHEDVTRPNDVAVMEAMMKSERPPWVGFVVTLIQVGSILYGARLIKGGSPE